MTDKQREFFEILFGDKGKDEHITIFATNKENSEISSTQHYKTITGAIEYANKLKHHWNVYVNLATTDGAGRATENMISRNVIAFDFDKKDFNNSLNFKDIIHIFKKVGLYYHLLIDSGNGFHVYLKTDRTTDVAKLVSVNKSIASKVGADMGATVPTQVLRVPDTYNHKSKKPKFVKTIFKADKILNHDIERLHQKYVFDTEIEETNLKYVSSKNMPSCIEQIIKGVPEGERNFCLGRLTKYFQMQNNSYSQALAIIKEWNTKNSPPLSSNSIEYGFKKYWEGNYLLMGCKSPDASIQAILSKYCNKFECSKVDKYEVIYTNASELVAFLYRELDTIKYRKGRVLMNGNHIVIITTLRQSQEGLNYKQLEQELTSTITKKCCMSRATIYKVLDELEELGIIDKIAGNRKTIPTLYKIKDIDIVEKEYLAINHHAIRRYVDGAVGQSALRVYVYMKYRLAKGENVVQTELADDMGLSQQRLSQCMQELEQARYVKSTLTFDKSKFGACVYEFM